MRIAGAESNTAIGLAKLGHSASFISNIGADSFGKFMLRMLRAEGVDTSGINVLSDYPTGVMFKEVTPTDTMISYYRAGSAASNLSPENLSTDSFKEARIFHFTGITPVLSETCRDTIFHAIRLADQNDCKISFDPNIRIKLWKGNDYTPLMKELAAEAHYLMLGLEEAGILYGTDNIDELTGILFTSDRLEALAIKNGADGVWICDRNDSFFIPPYPCKLVDPVGAGDAFNAGFLSGILRDKPLDTAGKMGAIMGAHATETRGDIEGMLTYQELRDIMNEVIPVTR